MDLDDTLLPDRASSDRALQQLASNLGHAPIDTKTAYQLIRDAWHKSSARGSRAFVGASSWEALWTAPESLTPAYGVDTTNALIAFQKQALACVFDDANDLASQYREMRLNETRSYSWVPAYLQQMSEHYELWCATNGSSSLQREKLNQAGIDAAFSRVWVSGELGFDKRSPYFAQLIERAASRTGQKVCVVIGDSDEGDGSLAERLGCYFIKVLLSVRPPVDVV